MQRSSSSIASLAAALAKAQAVLANPEKSLIAKLPPDRPGGTERTFRYASLASGLDIVRKTLGEHEIATVQTTAVDQGAGIIQLTTVLAHSSGEWISSDWPVGPIGDAATPHRIGAALTYARRHALFTLVGIAGEDDLDAPNLAASTGQGPALEKVQTFGNGEHRDRPSRPIGNGKGKASSRSALEAGDGAEVRNRLLAEIAEIGSADDAALWAYCNMRAKNGLTAGDARQIDDAFQTRLAGFTQEDLSPEGLGFPINPPAGDPGEAAAPNPCARPSLTDSVDATPAAPTLMAKTARARRTGSAAGVDKAVLALSEPRRIRDREHVRFVAKQPCLVCGRAPSDPHHLRFAQSRALGCKVSDEFTVPLCRGHHREVHRCGDETVWWNKAGMDPTIAARELWLRTRPLPRDPKRS